MTDDSTDGIALNVSHGSGDEEEDDDYIPESLRAFVMEADKALQDQKADFFNELAPSPRNTSIESADAEIQLGSIQSEMERVTIQDKNDANAKKAEMERLEKQRLEQERLAKEAAAKAAEEEMLAEESRKRAEEEAERRRIEELELQEQMARETFRLQKEEEERLAEEQRQKDLEEARQAEEIRLAEIQQQKQIEEEQVRIAEEQRQKQLAATAEQERLAKILQQQKLAEEEAEKERLAKQEQEKLVKKAAEEERLFKLEQKRLAEEQRLAKLEQERLANLEKERLAKMVADKRAAAEAARLQKQQEEDDRKAAANAARMQQAETDKQAADFARLEKEKRDAEVVKKAAQEAAKKKASGGLSGFWGSLKQTVSGDGAKVAPANMDEDAGILSAPNCLDTAEPQDMETDDGLAAAMLGLKVTKDTAEAPHVAATVSPIPTQANYTPPANDAQKSQEKTPASSASYKRSSPMVSSRLFAPTSASKAHALASKAIAGDKSPSAPSRLLKSPVAAGTSYGKRAASSRDSSIPKPAVRAPTSGGSRFMQPTVAKRAHEREAAKEESPSKKRTGPSGITRPEVPSRLLRGTAAYTMRAKESVKVASPSSLGQKRSNDDAVARARARVHQRKLAEKATESYGNGSDNDAGRNVNFTVGTKSPSKTKPPRDKKQGFGYRAPTAHFALATSSAKSHQYQSPSADATLAQSDDIFGRALRRDVISPSNSSLNTGDKRLTIPKTPAFATTKLHGKPKREAKIEETMSLAQSTELLARQLRTFAPAPSTSRPTKLTLPQAPRFHTIHKRPLPKSSAEIEAEELAKFKNFQSLPYRGNEKALHTRSSAGLTKVRKRNLTKPVPFNLSGGSGSGARPKVTQDNEDNDQGTNGKRTKGFRAKAMPDFSFSEVKTTRARTVTKPEPFKFAVSMKKENPPSSTSNGRSPRGFKARPLPKKILESPTIPVHEVKKPTPPPKPGPPPVFGTKKPRPLTTPEPFKLESVQRHDIYQELLQEKVASENEAMKKGMSPKALPLPNTTYEPFSPQLG